MITLELLRQKCRGALHSLTIKFTLAMGIIVPFLDYLQYQLPTIQMVLPSNLYSKAFGLVTVVNLFIRFFKTRQALEDKPIAKAME